MPYTATKQHVLNRGVPPDAFLDEIVAWGKEADDEIFAPNESSDVYSSVMNTLGPWQGLAASARGDAGSDAGSRRV